MAKTVITGDVYSYNKAVEFVIAHASKYFAGNCPTVLDSSCTKNQAPS